MSHQFQRSAASLACSARATFESRLDEYVKAHNGPPIVIHMTQAMATAIATELVPEGARAMFPKDATLTLVSGPYLGTFLHVCSDSRCTTGCVFINSAGEEEPI